jgi:N-acetylglucosamine-6-phosphate deacetylase
MMTDVLSNARVLTDQGFRDRQSVVLHEGLIQAVMHDDEVDAGDATVRDLNGQLLLPGFIDIQVNGGGGVLFNDAPGVEAIRAIGEAHRKFGTTGFLPTLISGDLEAVAAAIAATDEAIAAGVPGVLGIHLEGPFLNKAKKGVHDPAKFRVLDSDAIILLSSLKRGKTLVTLAPETTSPELIAELVNAGVIVAAGHTNGSYDEVRAALDAGLNGFTHLFNAMSPLTSREPGVVGAALDDDSSWCGLIADGHHVHPASLRIAIASKPRGRSLLVTDAMSSVGAVNKSFEFNGQLIDVSNGVCVTADGTLAGSDLDMATAVRNATTMLRVELAEAARMASEYPAAALGLEGELGRIKAGYRANLVLADLELDVSNTWIDGRSVA